MENNSNNSAQALGAEAGEEMDIKTISGWLQKDLDSMVTLLQAIRTDTELREYMARWFHGRMLNQKHKEVLSNGR